LRSASALLSAGNLLKVQPLVIQEIVPPTLRSGDFKYTARSASGIGLRIARVQKFGAFSALI